jgi:hypothetical protein
MCVGVANHLNRPTFSSDSEEDEDSDAEGGVDTAQEPDADSDSDDSDSTDDEDEDWDPLPVTVPADPEFAVVESTGAKIMHQRPAAADLSECGSIFAAMNYQ